MLSLLFFINLASPSFQSAMLNVKHSRRYVFTLRRTAWFAENSAISNEYGLTTRANNQLYVIDLVRVSAARSAS